MVGARGKWSCRRNGEPWTHKEDLKLIKLMGAPDREWRHIADEMRRSIIACENRWCLLRNFLSKSNHDIAELKETFAATLINQALTKANAALAPLMEDTP